MLQPNCRELSARFSLSLAEKKEERSLCLYLAFIYILSHTRGVGAAWSLLHGPTAA